MVENVATNIQMPVTLKVKVKILPPVVAGERSPYPAVDIVMTEKSHIQNAPAFQEHIERGVNHYLQRKHGYEM